MRSGLTLIEILVVIGIIILLFSLGLFFSMDSFRGYSFHAEEDKLVTILQRARSKSLANIDQASHGVHIDVVGSAYVLFEGTVYNPVDPKNEPTPIEGPVTLSGLTDVLFDQLSGASNTPGTITISGGGKSATVIINNEGRIDW